MKTKMITILLLITVMLVMFSSCDMLMEFIDSRTRPIPLIEIYNSNLEKNLKMVPNETLYAAVNGLEPGKMYTVQALDIDRKLITELMMTADEEGSIKPTPLWYDIGFIKDATGNLTLPASDLGVNSFFIRVFDDENTGSTDFELSFWFVSTNDNFDRKKPVIISGKNISGSFYMENAFYSSGEAPAAEDYTDELYIQVENMSVLRSGGEKDNVRIYIVPFSGESYPDKANIGEKALFYFDKPIDEFYDVTNEPVKFPVTWPASKPTSPISVAQSTGDIKIPAWAEGASYSIFLDMMDNGTYAAGIYDIRQEGFDSFYLDSIDGNGVAGFIVKKPPQPPQPVPISLNLASGGMFKWNYSTWSYDYDYRDEFISSGSDTQYASHSGAFWGRGIKVIWNPYLTPSGWAAADVPVDRRPSNFNGRYVDVYVLNNGATGGAILADNTINSSAIVRRARLPVQYGCSNGWWTQTIWRAPTTVGNYRIVVDMNFDGIVDATDLVDNGDTDAGIDVVIK